MNDPVSDLSKTIVAKSDQLNADDLLTGAITITVTAVKAGNADQPTNIHYEGDGGKPYKPCKTVRRVLVAAWGKNGHDYVGRAMTLYNDPEVMFGGIKVGGIRVSHLSHIENDLSVSLNKTKGKKAVYTVKRLSDGPRKPAPQQKRKAAQQSSQSNGYAASSNSGVVLSADQVQEITDALEAAGKTAEDLCSAVAGFLGLPIERVAQIPASEYENVCGWIANP